MSKTLKTTLLAVMLLLGSGKVGYVQDLRKGLEAYNRGDYVTALKELKPLAEQGNTDAQFRLGWMYYDGAGVVQDKVYAYMWVNIVALNSVTTEYEDTVREIIASNSRRTFAKEMTPPQIEEAQRLARECIRKEYKGC